MIGRGSGNTKIRHESDNSKNQQDLVTYYTKSEKYGDIKYDCKVSSMDEELYL